MAYQLTRYHEHALRPSMLRITHRIDLPAGNSTGIAAEEKWPSALRVLFIAGSSAVLWALIIACLLWLFD